MRRVMAAAAAVALTTLAFAPTAGTSALSSDRIPLDGGTIGSGELLLLNGNSSTQTASYAFSELAGDDLVPGGGSQAPLTIRNGGSVDLAYRLKEVTATDPTGLPASMSLMVQRVEAHANCPAGAGAADPSTPGVSLYDGPLLGASTPASRLLVAGSTEILCIRVTVVDAAPPAAQNRRTTITFTLSVVST